METDKSSTHAHSHTSFELLSPDIERELQQAIRNQEFELYYEPIIRLSTNRMVGAEALIRWNHPTRGVVSPAEFLPLAEETGHSVEIGNWVIQTVCEQLRKWELVGQKLLKISINISLKQLLHENFIETVSAYINQNGINSRFLEFELAERLFIDREEEIEPVVIALKKLGIQMALDDFGTGISSLTLLQKYKFHTIKLDRLFISSLERKSDSAAITEALLHLAKHFHYTVVAEGVENQEQVHLLKKLGCHEVQGYLYGEPAPALDFEILLTEETEWAKALEEKRKYFRVDVSHTVEADMTIVRLNKKKVKLGTTRVPLHDIGPGGLSFATSINLPITEDLAIKFTTTILNNEISLIGNPVWIKEENEKYHYGIHFNLSEEQRSDLIKLFNKLLIMKRKSRMLVDG
ncbi:EAL domain-containing protein [Bacillus sp. BGMRC 2118]|nr:EAL domain-containing protein [Bacillus sp. BGMRC 2118]